MTNHLTVNPEIIALKTLFKTSIKTDFPTIWSSLSQPPNLNIITSKTHPNSTWNLITKTFQNKFCENIKKKLKTSTQYNSLYHHTYTQVPKYTQEKKSIEFRIRFIIFSYKQTTNFSDFAINLKLKKNNQPQRPFLLMHCIAGFIYNMARVSHEILYTISSIYNVHGVHGRTRTFNTHKI